MMQELLKKVRRVEIKIRRLVNTTFAGEYRSAFRGSGLEFDEARPYQFGDDVRAIDWNVTAKTDKVHVKVFREEREQNIGVIFDVSGSERFGIGREQKFLIGAELTALLAFSSLKNNDRFGLTLFSDRIEKYYKAGKGRNHILRMIGDLLEYQTKSPLTNIKQALDFYLKTHHRRGILFVVSDFIDQGYERTLIQAAQRHDVILVRLFHPDESLADLSGIAPVIDLETGRESWIAASGPMFADSIGQAFGDIERRLSLFAKQHRMGFVNLNAAEDYLPPLLAFFHQRARQKGARKPA